LVNLAFVNYHAHDIGSEMYTRITRNGKSYNLASMRQWNFNDQINVNLAGRKLTLQDGDVVQTTCVFNTAGTGSRPARQDPTRFGFDSDDEMCLALAFVYPSTTGFRCTDGDSPVYLGQLSDEQRGTELGLGIHLEQAATEKWVPTGACKGSKCPKEGPAPSGNVQMCASFGAGSSPCPYKREWSHPDASQAQLTGAPSVTSSLVSAPQCGQSAAGKAKEEASAGEKATAGAAGKAKEEATETGAGSVVNSPSSTSAVASILPMPMFIVVSVVALAAASLA